MSGEKYIKTATGKWEAVIGLEVHAQVISESKLFSSSSTREKISAVNSAAEIFFAVKSS